MLSKQQPFSAHWAGVTPGNPQLVLWLGDITHVSKSAWAGAEIGQALNSSLCLPTPPPRFVLQLNQQPTGVANAADRGLGVLGGGVGRPVLIS